MDTDMLHIEKQYAQEIIAHALEDDPNECCGILGGKDGRIQAVYRMTNVEASPFRYTMDPVEQLNVYRELGLKGWETIAVYHSHTHSPAYPSPTDVRLATWPEECYILVTLMDRENPAIRAFHIDGDEVTEERLVVGGSRRWHLLLHNLERFPRRLLFELRKRLPLP
jgi:proteasome lid subunit RPN8/RPN11